MRSARPCAWALLKKRSSVFCRIDASLGAQLVETLLELLSLGRFANFQETFFVWIIAFREPDVFAAAVLLFFVDRKLKATKLRLTVLVITNSRDQESRFVTVDPVIADRGNRLIQQIGTGLDAPEANLEKLIDLVIRQTALVAELLAVLIRECELACELLVELILRRWRSRAFCRAALSSSTSRGRSCFVDGRSSWAELNEMQRVDRLCGRPTPSHSWRTRTTSIRQPAKAIQASD